MCELFSPQMEIFITFLRFVYRQLTERVVKEWPRKNELFGGGWSTLSDKARKGWGWIYLF